MDSPIHIGDTTTNSIVNRLQDTHINSIASVSISSNSYSGQQVIELTISFKDKGHSKHTKREDENGSILSDDEKSINDVHILRRVQDSYVNITQVFQILIKLELFTEIQIEKFLRNEILNNPQYVPPRGYEDFRKHDNTHLRGLWIPYDKAVTLALKFDIYEFCKKLFLVDVHDYESLPKGNNGTGKRSLYESSFDGQDASLMGSPSKKQKRPQQANASAKVQDSKDDAAFSLDLENPNAPYTLPPQNIKEHQSLVSDIKMKYSEVFKKDDDTSSLTFEDIKELFEPIVKKHHTSANHQYYLTDLPLDQQGKTALHFASTLASVKLVSSFIKLGLCSPIRGTISGESPLISTISVTNSMEKGNFHELLSDWLYPSLWLFDKKKWSFLHYLASQSAKKDESSRYYLLQILVWIMDQSDSTFKRLSTQIINLQDLDNENTCLHIAAENESKWLINILLELNANVNLANKTGLKPIDYDIVKEVLEEKENDAIKLENEQEGSIIELIRVNVDLLRKKEELGATDDVIGNTESSKSTNEKAVVDASSNGVNSQDGTSSSSKIFQSIQHLLANTNKEYETLIKYKKDHLISLNEKLHDASIITANNRFISKKINEKLIFLDNIKLQMGNITDKLELSKREIPEELVEQMAGNGQDEDINTNYDADEPFRIPSLYNQMQSGEIDKIEVDEVQLSELPSLAVLQARVKAYEEINNKIETELAGLSDYSELTSKFKKVVSFCTGVDINEVDDLLDGLLEAVEGQQ